MTERRNNFYGQDEGINISANAVHPGVIVTKNSKNMPIVHGIFSNLQNNPKRVSNPINMHVRGALVGALTLFIFCYCYSSNGLLWQNLWYKHRTGRISPHLFYYLLSLFVEATWTELRSVLLFVLSSL